MKLETGKFYKTKDLWVCLTPATLIAEGSVVLFLNLEKMDDFCKRYVVFWKNNFCIIPFARDVKDETVFKEMNQ